MMYDKYIKRGFDLFLSIIALILLFPVIVITAVLVKIFIGSPVLFIQKRPGRNGKLFRLYKFRTMTNKKDARGILLPDEKRLTKFGQFLRSASLDETVSLWNVIKGDMSIVGPRPLLVSYLKLYSKKQMHRHDVRPGITGWAQVNGRNAISWEEKFRYDLEYVKKESFLFDLKIIFLTFEKVLKREGIQQDGHATVEKFTGNKKRK